MPLGPLNFMSFATRVAKPFIDAARAVGRSARQVATAVRRATGRVLRRPIEPPIEEVRKVIALEEEIERRAGVVRELPRGRIPDPDTLPFSVGKQRRKFSYRIRGLVTDPFTGLLEERFVTIATDALISIEQALTAADEFFSDYAEQEEGEVEFMEVTSITRASSVL